MKFLVGKNRQVAVQVARVELQWEQTGQFTLLDLYRDEVMVVSRADQLRGHSVEVVYLLPSFEDLPHDQWEGFQRAFAMGKIKTMRL